MSMRNLVMAVLVVAVGVMAVPVQATIIYWSGATSDWHTATNWGAIGQVPTANDDPYITVASSTCIISSGNDGVARAVQVGRSGTGALTVTGDGSTLTVSGNHIYIGTANSNGNGTLSILSGGVASCVGTTYIGVVSGSGGLIEVIGNGSELNAGDALRVGHDASSGTCTLNIFGGGLVSVGGTMTIDVGADGSDFVNMKTGGMLALNGDVSNLTDFLDLVIGTDAIRYWDGSAWDDITHATEGTHYTITAGTGDLSGYTVLTVPEPTTIGLLGIGGLLALVRKSRRR